MVVDIKPKVMISHDASILADLNGIEMDLDFALFCFERFDSNKLFKFNHLGEDRINYALATSALIHYRRAFNTGVRRFKLHEKMIAECPCCAVLHSELKALADKQVAHSISNHEVVGTPISVAIDRDSGEATFRGVSSNSTYASLMSENRRMDAVYHVRFLLKFVVEPEMTRLQYAISETAKHLTSNELKSLPDGYPPHEKNLLKQRNWPPRAEL